MILSGRRAWGGEGHGSAEPTPDCLPSAYFGAWIRRKGSMATGPDGLREISPGARYSNGSISFRKSAFFRVPSILWATLPSLSMITVVGTTAMLP